MVLGTYCLIHAKINILAADDITVFLLPFQFDGYV